MTHTNTHRELILDISEITSNSNVFSIALKMMEALKNDEITSKQFTMLTNELQYECSKNNIEI
jgi:phosphoribosyl-dephospho-CoA transferase